MICTTNDTNVTNHYCEVIRTIRVIRCPLLTLE